MALITVTGLSWNNKVLIVDGQNWPFIQLNIDYDGELVDAENIFDFINFYTSGAEALQLFSGGISSCVYSGRNLSLGVDSYYGSGDVTLHRKVGNTHAGTLLHYDDIDYGFFEDRYSTGVWRNSVNYQFVVYDIKTKRYYVPTGGYLAMSRWTDPEYMGVNDYTGNPYAAVADGDEDPTVVTRMNFKYISAISDILETAKGETTDPYAPGGESDVGGGTGNFDGTSDAIDIPGLPTLSAIDTGFVTLYIPTTAQLRALAQYMWNADITTLDFWKKIVADPIDLILGLNIVPVAPAIAGTKSVNVGFIDTGVQMNYTNSQYVEVDCGTINVNEYWGAYLDYSPYTRAEIYLPYCGYHAIDADEIMGKAIRVVYHVDVLSGSCTAFIKCGDSVLYQFQGNCASAIPVTSSQYGDQVIAGFTLAAQLAALPAAGTGAAMAAAGAAGALESIGSNEDTRRHEIQTSQIGGEIADAASTVSKMKPNIARSGAIGGMGGQLAVQVPYIVLSRPRQSLPAGQNAFKGYPSNITAVLGNLSGYTVVDSIHLENIPCTLGEQAEIDRLLHAGVII